MIGAADFLCEYFQKAEGQIYLGAVRNAKSTLPAGEIGHVTVTARNPVKANKFVAEHDKPEDQCAIYFCTSTIRNGRSTRKYADCWQFTSLFADCDDHNHNLARDRVIELLEGAECPPTLIINSGHGLQPHWLLNEPSEDAPRITSARKKLQAIVASDAVHDVPRFMRLPGAHNSKGGDWLPVEIVSHHPERRYTLEVLEDWLDIASVIIPRKGKPKSNGGDGKPFVLPPASGTRTDHKRGAAWAHKALDESARELASAAEGSRHNTLRDKSVRMGTMIARGWIDAYEVRPALFAAAEACGQIKDYGVGHFNETFAAGLKHGLAMPHPDLPDSNPPGPDNGPHTEQSQPTPTPLALPWINMANWDNEPVPEQEWAVFDRIPLRQCVLYSGEGAVGKSIVLQQLCVAHVLARDLLGSMPEPGPAFYIEAEDDETVIHRRLAAILSHYDASFSDAVTQGLKAISLAGQDAVLAVANRSGRIEPTALYKQLLEAAGDIKPKMIGIASSANVYAGSEIDRSQVQQFVGLLTRVAIAANGSVVLASHPSLTGINTDSGISGTTQWHNAVRARFYMKSVKPEAGEQPDSDLREIVFKKNQYGAVSASIVVRYQNGLFLPVPGMASLDKATQEVRADEIFLDLLRRFTRENRFVSGKPSSNYAPALFAKEDEAKREGLTSKAFEGAMRRLFKAGTIWNEPCGKPSRPSYRIAIKTGG